MVVDIFGMPANYSELKSFQNIILKLYVTV